MDQIWEHLKDVNGIVGPALLILLGGIFRVWQMQIKMKADVLKEKADADERELKARLEREKIDAETRERAERIARENAREAERVAAAERQKLEDALERERNERQKEMYENVHHLKTKMQVYENQLGIYEKELEMANRERSWMTESLAAVKQQLSDRDKENTDLRRKGVNLQDRVDELERALNARKGPSP